MPNIRRAPLMFAVVSLFCASTAWASLTACPGTAQTLASITAQTNGVQPNGCEITDLQFNNYTATGSANSGPTTTSLISMTGSNAGTITANTSILGLTATYAPNGAGTWIAPNTGASTLTSAFDGLVTVDAGYPQRTSPNNFVITSLTLALGTLTLSSKTPEPSITVIENFCLGGTVSNVGANGGALSCGATADEGFIEIVVTETAGGPSAVDTCETGQFQGGSGGTTHTCNGASPLDPVFSIGRFTSVATQTTIDVNNTHTATAQGIASVTEGFNEEGTPEPSTFVLLGSALAVVGLLRLRARRKSAIGATQ